MSLTTTPRNYLTIAELQILSNLTVTDNDEALRQLDRAEKAIDDYIGYQCKSVEQMATGQVTSVNSLNVIDTGSGTPLDVTNGTYARCLIEIIGGTGAGQIRYIASSTRSSKSVTIVDAWDTAPDSTSIYKIYQLAKFPRGSDVNSNRDGTSIYKTIPEAIKKAVAAQIDYFISKGDDFFTGNDSNVNSERIGNYSYSRGGSGAAASVELVSPRVRSLLVGFKNSGGELINDNPTTL